MKKLLLTFALCAFGFVNAQTEKGSWVVGGSSSLGFNSVGTSVKADGRSFDGPKISNFNITPSIGYFVIDKLAIGVDLGYTSISTKYDNLDYFEDGEKITNSVFSVLPSATYYFKSDAKFLPYVGVGAGYGSNKTKVDSYSESSDGFVWKAKGGIGYLITNNVALDLGVSYNQFSNKDDVMGYEYKTKLNTFAVGVGLNIFL